MWEKTPSISKISRYTLNEYLEWSPHVNPLSHKLVKPMPYFVSFVTM